MQSLHFNLRVNSMFIILKGNFIKIYWKVSLYQTSCDAVKHVKRAKPFPFRKHRLAEIMSR